MCGINGTLVFGSSNFRVTETWIAQMRDTMSHRGPDGAGAWLSADRCVGLGHRRLSIIDLSRDADQPMCNEDGTLWIVFNGEIYNHGDVRKELEAAGGHRWRTNHSDTEVILHAFEEWGIDCLQRFRGMFAFALWDARQSDLWLVRDRIGVKPLYYSMHHGRLNFASEIKALLQDPQQPREINEQGLVDYLTFLTVPAPDTLFAGIKKLSPATWLRISASGDVQEHRYWDVWDHTTPLVNTSEEEIAQLLLEELRTAVRLRKMSDVPVGLFLSGGLDSSVNAALFSEGESRPVKAFSIGYAGEHRGYENEFRYARIMAAAEHMDYHELQISQEDFIQFLPAMVRMQDEPIGDDVCVPVYYVSKLARNNGVVVCQVGEGADELFWGYRSWRAKLALQKWNNLPVPRLVKRKGLDGLRLLGRETTLSYAYLERGAQGTPIFWTGTEAFTPAWKRRILSPRMRQRFSGYSSWQAVEPIRRRFDDNAWEKSHLHWMSYVDLSLRLPELLLMRVDKMSMAVSVEARVPFLDHRFVELAMSVPQSVKTKNNTSKYILKKAVQGLIPDEIIDRKKQGFATPIRDWLSTGFGPIARLELQKFCNETDYFDWQSVSELFESDDAERVWRLLNLALWWREYI